MVSTDTPNTATKEFKSSVHYRTMLAEEHMQVCKAMNKLRWEIRLFLAIYDVGLVQPSSK